MLSRHLKLVASAASLLLCVLAAIVWAHSYHHHDSFVSRSDELESSMSSALGTVRLVHAKVGSTARRVDPGWESRVIRPPTHALARLFFSTSRERELCVLGLCYLSGDLRNPLRSTNVPLIPYQALVLPYWTICAILTVLPVHQFMSEMRRRRRTGTRVCAACGYDLRATPHRCPEGGATPVPLAEGGSSVEPFKSSCEVGTNATFSQERSPG